MGTLCCVSDLVGDADIPEGPGIGRFICMLPMSLGVAVVDLTVCWIDSRMPCSSRTYLSSLTCCASRKSLIRLARPPLGTVEGPPVGAKLGLLNASGRSTHDASSPSDVKLSPVSSPLTTHFTCECKPSASCLLVLSYGKPSHRCHQM